VAAILLWLPNKSQGETAWSVRSRPPRETDGQLSYFPTNAKANSMTVIEIKPFRNGWKVFEAPGAEPVFLEQDQAISYASNRASFRSGEIRVLDSGGNIERLISFRLAQSHACVRA
jgi:hypothetical protein